MVVAVGRACWIFKLSPKHVSCRIHVAWSCVSAWKSLEINENICDIMQHQFVGPSSTKFLILLVRTAGLEPAQGFPQGILSPLRLPFRHVRGGGDTPTSVIQRRAPPQTPQVADNCNCRVLKQ